MWLFPQMLAVDKNHLGKVERFSDLALTQVNAKIFKECGLILELVPLPLGRLGGGVSPFSIIKVIHFDRCFLSELAPFFKDSNQEDGLEQETEPRGDTTQLSPPRTK